MKKTHKEEAAEIYNRMGSIDGRKHLDMIINFVKEMNSVKLVDYWNIVNKNFKNYEK